MIRILSGLLLLMVLFSSISDLMVYTCFKINQDKITNLFCVNKSKPDLSCYGQCHLTKIIKEGQNQKREDLKFEEHKVNLFFYSTLSVLYNFQHLNDLSSIYSKKILEMDYSPPQPPPIS